LSILPAVNIDKIVYIITRECVKKIFQIKRFR